MSDAEDDDSKQHEPTQKKLDDARKRGEVVRSTDLNTAMSYMALLVGRDFFGGRYAERNRCVAFGCFGAFRPNGRTGIPSWITIFSDTSYQYRKAPHPLASDSRNFCHTVDRCK